MTPIERGLLAYMLDKFAFAGTVTLTADTVVQFSARTVIIGGARTGPGVVARLLPDDPEVLLAYWKGRVDEIGQMQPGPDVQREMANALMGVGDATMRIESQQRQAAAEAAAIDR